MGGWGVQAGQSGGGRKTPASTLKKPHLRATTHLAIPGGMGELRGGYYCGIPLLVALALSVGCIHPRVIPPVDTGGPGKWLPVATQPPDIIPDDPGIRQVEFTEPTDDRPKISPLPRRPQHILALSGGGMFGAFTAGVLGGWTRTEKRPEFDVVTGISTGALIAPLAFLGPQYDGLMERFYTRITRKDIFTYQSWITVPFRDAVASTAPLRDIVESSMTLAMIDDIGKAHRGGRRLYVGTTNLDTRRFVTWDLGAIANVTAATEPERQKKLKEAKKLIVNVLVASCTMPVVFSPVRIEVEINGKKYTELHIDGGVTAPVFVPPMVLDAAAPDPRKPAKLQPPANLYLVQASKSYVEPAPVESRVLPVLSVSTATILSAQTRREASNLFHMCRVAGVNFNMTGIPADFPTPLGGLEFDRTEMNKLFEKGFEFGVAGPKWWSSPPERGPGESDTIRGGNKFTIEKPVELPKE